jgi:hypothetical protein
MIEAASNSETSIKFYQTTQRNIPEDMHLQQKYHQMGVLSFTFRQVSLLQETAVCTGFALRLDLTLISYVGTGNYSLFVQPITCTFTDWAKPRRT